MVTLFEVGGCVRDRLLGLDPHDIDFAVEADSYDEMKEWMEANGFYIWQERPQYFTIRAKFPKGWTTATDDYSNYSADFVLCRRESFYSDGRRPDEVFVGTIFDDLARRDFTMNAIAIRVSDNEVIDPHGGEQDIAWRTLRCVGTPEDRFKEDGLRVLRAIRFNITKGFHFHDTVLQAIESEWVVPLIEGVATERRREEIMKCFKHDTIRSIETLSRWPHLHKAIFAGGIWLKPTTEE